MYMVLMNGAESVTSSRSKNAEKTSSADTTARSISDEIATSRTGWVRLWTLYVSWTTNPLWATMYGTSSVTFRRYQTMPGSTPMRMGDGERCGEFCWEVALRLGVALIAVINSANVVAPSDL